MLRRDKTVGIGPDKGGLWDVINKTDAYDI